jgi:prepilin-type N-terminal cleavage/methylation domain-containing protein
MKTSNKHVSNSFGFTIVELLVVIVVIGILAAITIVTYAGISQKAIAASLQSDLSNAATALKNFQVDNGTYPTTISTNCTTNPDTSTNKCLKVSSGNSYNYIPGSSNGSNYQSFSLTATNPSLSYSYIVTDNGKIASLAPAPLNPVADWLATSQGDHYGNYYDLVGKSWATVTRSTPKTIYDPNTQHIYDVPANYLGITPRSDGKSGVEATVEEARTNYLTNSYGAANNGSNWTTGWSLSGSTVGTPTYSLVTGLYGNTAQRIQYTGIVGDTGTGSTYLQPLIQATAKGSFSAGDSATVTAYIKGQLTGVTAHISLYAYDINNIQVGSGVFTSNFSSSSNWTQLSVNYPSLPTNTSYLVSYFFISGIGPGTSVDLSVGAIQLEKGAFATSYIPTTTTAVTRNADVVTVPTTGWNLSAGTLVGVSGQPPLTDTNPAMVARVYTNVSDVFGLATTPTTYGGEFWDFSGGNSQKAQAAWVTGYRSIAGVWTDGTLATVYLNGGTAVNSSGNTSNASSFGTAYIGCFHASAYFYDGPIQRLTVYNLALSSGNVSTVTSAVQNGPQ